MDLLLQVSINQLFVASLYALIAVGFVIIYRSTHVINFAQGTLAALGGYIFYSFQSNIGMNFAAAMVAAVLASFVLGAVIYYMLLRPAKGATPLTLVMITIALNIVLSGLILLIWGGDQRFPEVPIHGTFDLLGATVFKINAVSFLIACVLLLIFWLMLKYAELGVAMRAVASSPTLASYRGLPIGRASAIAWGLALVGATFAGVAYGASAGLQPGSTAAVLGLAAFPAIILGGLDSIPGALLGALILAEAQGLAIVYLGGRYGDVVGYVLLLLVLVLRPQGIFGAKEVVRL